MARANGIFETGSKTIHSFHPKTVALIFLACLLARTSGRFSRETRGTSPPTASVLYVGVASSSVASSTASIRFGNIPRFAKQRIAPLNMSASRAGPILTMLSATVSNENAPRISTGFVRRLTPRSLLPCWTCAALNPSNPIRASSVASTSCVASMLWTPPTQRMSVNSTNWMNGYDAPSRSFGSKASSRSQAPISRM